MKCTSLIFDKENKLLRFSILQIISKDWIPFTHVYFSCKQITESSKTIQNKQESGKTDHQHKLGKVGRTMTDDYDHAGPAFTIVKEQQQWKHNAEQCNTNDTVRLC